MQVWLEIFVVVATVAIVLQMAILVAMYVQFRAISQQLRRITGDLQSKVDPVLLRITRILEDSESRIGSVMADAVEITHLARSQAQKVDRVFTDAVDRMRTQVIRADQIVTGALEVVEEAGYQFRRTLYGPLRNASAFLRGLRAGLEFLRGQGSRREAVRSQQDEELFI